MTRQSLLMLLLVSSQAFAATPPVAPQSSKEAAARYASDKALCAEEKTSSTRMQCLRDAKAEYDAALAALKAAPATAGAVCNDCGKVLSVQMEEKKGEAGALGTIGGGVAGALLGNQVGGGNGKTLATIAGAAGGAYAGRKVEENMKATKVWTVKVKMDAGGERSFSFDHDPGFAAGNGVKVSGNTIVRR